MRYDTPTVVRHERLVQIGMTWNLTAGLVPVFQSVISSLVVALDMKNKAVAISKRLGYPYLTS